MRVATQAVQDGCPANTAGSCITNHPRLHPLLLLLSPQALHLEELQQRPWQIVGTNGLTGEGLDRAMEWLATKLLRS